MDAQHCLIAMSSALGMTIDGVLIISLMPHALEVTSNRVSTAMPSVGERHEVVFAIHSAPSLACIPDQESASSAVL